MKKKRKELNYRDPVCGMLLSKKTAATTVEYRRRMYLFCAEICRDKFEESPDDYAGRRRLRS